MLDDNLIHILVINYENHSWYREYDDAQNKVRKLMLKDLKKLGVSLDNIDTEDFSEVENLYDENYYNKSIVFDVYSIDTIPGGD